LVPLGSTVEVAADEQESGLLGPLADWTLPALTVLLAAGVGVGVQRAWSRASERWARDHVRVAAGAGEGASYALAGPAGPPSFTVAVRLGTREPTHVVEEGPP
jgi:hypothetical protein